MDLRELDIAFIGAGNMAGALIRGLLASGVDGGRLWAADPDPDQLARFADSGIHTDTDNARVIARADVAVLAVKPQQMQAVLEPLQAALMNRPCLLISIAAGVSLDSLQQWTHADQAIVRCMPNTPALVASGASALVACDKVSAQQRDIAAAILAAVGSVCWLEREEDMHAVTALSGSGPAYFFLLMETMQEAAESLGLARETAADLAVQTALGSARLARESGESPAELRRRVTSPGGTTAAALEEFERGGFRELVARALAGAATRSRELAGGDNGAQTSPSDSE